MISFRRNDKISQYSATTHHKELNLAYNKFHVLMFSFVSSLSISGAEAALSAVNLLVFSLLLLKYGFKAAIIVKEKDLRGRIIKLWSTS